MHFYRNIISFYLQLNMSTDSEDIFYRPSDSNIELTNEPSDEDLSSRVVLVCFLCFRQYDLEEDLRGHMIEYHKYKLIKEPAKNNSEIEIKKALDEVEKNENPAAEAEVKEQLPLISSIDNEMKPMPFKDFRLLLRCNMALKCPRYSNCIYKFETEEKLKQHSDCHADDKTTFQCYICSMKLNNWRRCSAHLWKAHQLDVDLLKCPICEFKSHASGKSFMKFI